MVRGLMRAGCLALLLLTQGIVAHAATHSLGKYKVEFTDEQGFTPVEGLWGVGFSLVSKLDEHSGLRTSIGVFDMEVNDVHFDYSVLEKNVNDYYEGRKKWLGGLDGAKWLKELPFKRVENQSNKVDGYRIGFEYELGGVAQVQYSYYLMCNKRMFHLKTLYAADAETQATTDLNRIVKSFRCESDDSKIGAVAASDIRENWKTVNSKPENREEVAAALRDFLMDYEVAHGKDDDSQSRASLIRSFMERFLTPSSAYAANAGCFYAGWESHWGTENGKTTCEEPNEAKGCGAGQIKCNTAVFGSVCISDDFRATATQVCNAEYKRDQKKHDEELKNYLVQNPEATKQLEQATDELCGSDVYRNANYGLCTTLYNRIGKIAGGDHPLKKLSQPSGADPTDYQKAYDVTQGEMRLFENFCMSPDKKAMYASVTVEGKVVDCVSTKAKIVANLKALDKVDSRSNFKPIGSACDVGPISGMKEQIRALQKNENSCTKAEVQARGHCAEDLACSVLASGVPVMLAAVLPKVQIGSCNISQDGCLQHAASGIMEALWGTVKGLYDMVVGAVGGLVSDSAKGVKNLAKGALNFFGASYKIDDASSYKIVQLAKTGNGMLSKFLAHPLDTIADFFKGIWAGINTWMMNDVFCEEWSGVPHLSTCKMPSSGWSCMSCKQGANGFCTALGYVASEIVGTVLTGGAKGVLDAAGVTAKVTSMLSKAGEIGKLKYARFADEYPKLAGAIKVTGEAAQGTGKVIGKTYEIGKDAIGLPLKYLAGKTKDVIGFLDKIPVLNLPLKAVKLTATQARNFGKWYADLSEKAFASGEGMGQGLASDIKAARNANKTLAVQEANRVASESKLSVQANAQFDRAANNLASGKSYNPRLQTNFTQSTQELDKDVIPNLVKKVEESSQGKAKLEALDDRHLKLTRTTDAGTETKLVVVGPDGSLNVSEFPKDFRKSNLREPASAPAKKYQFLVEEESAPAKTLVQKEANRVVKQTAETLADQKATKQAMAQFNSGAKNLASGGDYVPRLSSEYTAAAKDLDPKLVSNLQTQVAKAAKEAGGEAKLTQVDGRYLKLTRKGKDGVESTKLVVLGEDGSLRLSEYPKGFDRNAARAAKKADEAEKINAEEYFRGVAENKDQKSAWAKFQKTLSSNPTTKNFTTEQSDALLKDLYNTHMTGTPGTMEKKRALVEMRNKLQEYGLTEAEARTAIRDLGDTKILGVFTNEEHLAVNPHVTDVNFNRTMPADQWMQERDVVMSNSEKELKRLNEETSKKYKDALAYSNAGNEKEETRLIAEGDALAIKRDAAKAKHNQMSIAYDEKIKTVDHSANGRWEEAKANPQNKIAAAENNKIVEKISDYLDARDRDFARGTGEIEKLKDDVRQIYHHYNNQSMDRLPDRVQGQLKAYSKEIAAKQSELNQVIAENTSKLRRNLEKVDPSTLSAEVKTKINTIHQKIREGLERQIKKGETTLAEYHNTYEKAGKDYEDAYANGTKDNRASSLKDPDKLQGKYGPLIQNQEATLEHLRAELADVPKPL
jgi:hypothetical protein